jgi:cellulose synthase/poly-beta-1,6-N-acetylglucosamine synthase-like glycosyltransferase
VVVAARNEERHLEGLLGSLLSQEYPAFEVIVVNDRSTDRSRDILASFQEKDPRLKCVHVEQGEGSLPPKQNALTLGVKACRGEILCLTDADSRPGPRWVASLAACFSSEVGIATGYAPRSPQFLPSPRNPGSQVVDEFIRFEGFRKALWSAAAAGLGLAWGCAGANLAFRRSAFDAVGGYRSLPYAVSGDDSRLLQLIARKTRWRFRYLISPENFVPTAPPEDLRGLLRQHVRQFSGAQKFSLSFRLFYYYLHTAHQLLVAGLIVSFFSPTHRAIGLAGFAVMMAADAVFFLSGAARFRQWRFAPSFPAMELFCLAYYSFLPLIALARRPKWKD